MSPIMSVEMDPRPGQSRVAFVGDCLQIRVHVPMSDTHTRCLLRCNVEMVFAAHQADVGWQQQGAWQDLPMQQESAHTWVIDLPLFIPGCFEAKARVIDGEGRSYWPEGPNVEIVVHPASWRSGNTIYCTFVRMHGENRLLRQTRDSLRDEQCAVMDRHGWTVIPPSGRLRDLIRDVPHIVEKLGCRIIHLLPINPTPTTHARYGRFGSPYAATDFTSIDPALVEHDRCSSGLDQFTELVDCVHDYKARLIIDLAINHTGWNSRLQNEHPEWFKKDAQSQFISPGAWGTIWEDLSELDHSHEGLWDYLAETFLFWCRRGVDGFRCDAGYMVPLVAWRRISERVRSVFPETLFLLEGLGGAWEDSARLLRQGGMHWAYSELFQNYDPQSVSSYLDHSFLSSQEQGILVHYSETHDNARLAAYCPDRVRSRRWSLLRNRLCALTAVNGAYGFTAGVEWLADEKLEVHQSRGLNWGAEDNIVAELAQLNLLLNEHPCFLDGAQTKRISTPDSPVYALLREAGDDVLLVLVNLDLDQALAWQIPGAIAAQMGASPVDLLGQEFRLSGKIGRGREIMLEAGQALCLSALPWKNEYQGSERRQRQYLAGLALQALGMVLPLAHLVSCDTWQIAALLADDPVGFFAALPRLQAQDCAKDLVQALKQAIAEAAYPALSLWRASQHPRVMPVPSNHWLLLSHHEAFSACLEHDHEQRRCSVELAQGQHWCWFPPQNPGSGRLTLHAPASRSEISDRISVYAPESAVSQPDSSQGMVLLTNGRGGMARLSVDFAAIRSKYDAALAVNLHELWPVDRHVMLKRLRAWAEADGFLSPLNARTLHQFTHDEQSAHWHFRVGCGNHAWLDLHLMLWMEEGVNGLFCRLWRSDKKEQVPCQVILRPDLEDRSFHSETQHNPETEAHFVNHIQAHEDGRGISFTPAQERSLHICSDHGHWEEAPEWSNCAHPIEADRGQHAHGDSYSPGIFRCDVAVGQTVSLTVQCSQERPAAISSQAPAIPQPASDLEQALRRAIQAYLVRREEGKTVIAGYPWFLDWGRDTLICARGYLAAGFHDEVADILRVFGRFEEGGTLPNIIHGENVGNRDTVDAPLWYGIVAEELAEREGLQVLQEDVGNGRRIIDILYSIVAAYREGTSNGVLCDLESGLVWSPSHFTWMDTNYPAGTPRRGYPIEIQALWIRLLRFIAQVAEDRDFAQSSAQLAERACYHLDRLFWLPELGWWSDCLIAERSVPAQKAVRDNALRSNLTLPIALGVLGGAHARSSLSACAQHLVVPGALRSLAPLPLSPGLPIRNAAGDLLNDPHFPYQGHYQGDEDSRRKPAYHNGTAWTWTFPSFCEALIRAWPEDAQALASARSYLNSIIEGLQQGCQGHIAEILDGDVPHQQRGCDAQAWGATEALRVLLLLQSPSLG